MLNGEQWRDGRMLQRKRAAANGRCWNGSTYRGDWAVDYTLID